MRFCIIDGELFVMSDREVWHLLHRGADHPTEWQWEVIPYYMFEDMKRGYRFIQEGELTCLTPNSRIEEMRSVSLSKSAAKRLLRLAKLFDSVGVRMTRLWARISSVMKRGSDAK